MPFGRPEVRFPFRLLDLCFHTLKLTFADRRQVLSVWSRSRLLIQENRYSDTRRGHLLARLLWRARIASSIVHPLIGIKGRLSTAPIRGCCPECFVRSISSTPVRWLRAKRPSKLPVHRYRYDQSVMILRHYCNPTSFTPALGYEIYLLSFLFSLNPLPSLKLGTTFHYLIPCTHTLRFKEVRILF